MIARFDDAEALSREATVRFPDEPWPWVERVRIAQARGDPAEAIQLSEQLRTQFPAHMVG
jgi:hypothetical protein